MINRSPYYTSYTAKKKEEQAKLSRYKIIILLLCKATHRNLQYPIEVLRSLNKRKKQKIQSMVQVVSKNHLAVIKQTLAALNYCTFYSKTQCRSILSCSRLLNRAEKARLQSGFLAITQAINCKNQKAVQSIASCRKKTLLRNILRLLSEKKQAAFRKIKQKSEHQQQILSKSKLIAIISKHFLKNSKSAAFHKIFRFSSVKSLIEAKKNSQLFSGVFQSSTNNSRTVSKNSSRVTESSQIQKHEESMKIKIQDMEVQIDNKNDTISRMQEEIQQLRAEISNQKSNFSFSEYTVNQRSNSLKKKSSHNDSVDNMSDFSIGSILGSSFTSLNRSRSKKKAVDSTFSLDCSCGFREKYIKFKNSNQSLKNQLQIVKEELEVAKDLNDHFTNQIRQYFGGQSEPNELQRLQNELKDAQSEKEELKAKVIKYQHTIATLKSEFKLKIEELYRKVKKQR